MKRKYGPSSLSNDPKRGLFQRISYVGILVVLGVTLVTMMVIAAYFSTQTSRSQSYTYDANKKTVYDNHQRQTLANTQRLGPLVITESNRIVRFNVVVRLPVGYAQYVELEVYDEQDNFLFSIGNELWHEQGYDSDGHWREDHSVNTVKARFEQPGTYFFRVISQTRETRHRPIIISFAQLNGSSRPALITGWILFFLMFGLCYCLKLRKKPFDPADTRITILITGTLMMLTTISVVAMGARGYGQVACSQNQAGTTFTWQDGNMYCERNVRGGSVDGISRIGGGPGHGK